MKILIIAVLFLMVSAGAVFASGDKNHGETGSGTTSTGSGAQGQASQPRSGR